MTNMDFERRYPHPKLQHEYFVVLWTRGYRSAELWYNNRLVIAVDEIKQLLKGVKLDDEILGKVEFKLEEEPYVLNVLVDGYHSKNNSKHPKNGINSVANWLIPGILYFLLGSMVTLTVLYSSNLYSLMDKTEFYSNIVGLGIMITAYVLTRMVSPAFLFVGLIIYLLLLLLFTFYLLQFRSVHFLGILLYLGYLTFVGFMFLPIRRVISYLKHKKFDFNSETDVLDN